MARKDTWRASFLEGPLDGLVCGISDFGGPVPYQHLIPIPSDDDAFRGEHCYIVTELDITAKICEFMYTGERWEMASQ